MDSTLISLSPRKTGLLLAAILLLTIAMLASASAKEATGNGEPDPLESFNRTMFGVNEVIDTIALKPVAQLYRGVVPEYGQQRVHNVLHNLSMPVVFLNSVLQGDPENAFSSLWSFILNSTFGVAGIFDFTGENTNLVVRNEDFGQTLGSWGVGSGPYLVLPLLGPSSGRDTVGLVADVFSDPFNYMDDDIVITRTIARAIDARAGTIELLDEIYETSFDPYATIRSAYLQRRAAEVKNTHHNQSSD